MQITPQAPFIGVDTLDAYLAKYGPLLGRQAEENLKPLVNPLTDGDHPLIPELLRAPFPAQARTITGGAAALRHNKALLLVAEAGSGKAQPDDALVLTPTGYRKISQIKMGDCVIDPTTGGPCGVIGIFPQGEKEVFRVTFSDGTSTECCDDHLWQVQTSERRARNHPPHVWPLSKIREKYIAPNGKRRLDIPMTSPIHMEAYSPHDRPLDPYVLGVILGNGCIAHDPQLSLTAPDPELRSRFLELAPEGLSLKKKEPLNEKKYDYRMTFGGRRYRGKNKILNALRSLDLTGFRSEAKFIPDQYIYAPVDVRIGVLQGLFDTDGSPAGTAVDYSTASSRMADQVVFLVQTLGGTAKLSVRDRPTYTYKGEKRVGQPSYRVRASLPVGVNPFRLSRKAKNFTHKTKYRPHRHIHSIEPVGRKPCRCIAVNSQSKLYVTNDCIVTHNTLMSQAIVHCHSNGRPYNALVMCPGQLVKKWKREIEETLPDAHATILDKCSDLIPIWEYRNAGGYRTSRNWFIIGRDSAKLGPGRRGAYDLKTVNKGMGRKPHCPRCGTPIMKRTKEGDMISWALREELDKELQDCEACGEPLWQLIPQPRRFEPAKFIHKKLRGMLDYFIADEMHELKGADTAQANALGSLVAASKHVIAMTGTLIGGYADHLRALLWRLCPRTLVADGFKWEDHLPFSDRYGRIEIKTVEKEGAAEGNRQSRGSKKNTSKYVRPGIVPSLYGNHLIGNAIFLGLDEMGENLPILREKIFSLSLDPPLYGGYEAIEKDLRRHVNEMLRKGDRRLLSTLLSTLLAWPDYPFGWGQIGYKDRETGGFVRCADPPDLPRDVVYAKERALLDFCHEERALGRQAWVYVQYNGLHNVEERLRSLFDAEGFRVGVLKATVPVKEREAWIEKNGVDVDVMLSHPMLVQTGLDLFDKGGFGHNFCTLAFYETGYVLPVLRQASRRAWRLKQPKDCKVAYFFYKGTMQERAMNLMGQKLIAAEALEGKFSSEGLIALAGDDGMETALARSLVSGFDETVGRTPGKFVFKGKTREAV